MKYEINFENSDSAQITLDANKFSEIFADYLARTLTFNVDSWFCTLHSYRNEYRSCLRAEWRDANGSSFNYIFQMGISMAIYNVNETGVFQIASCNTMAVVDSSDAIGLICLINNKLHRKFGKNFTLIFDIKSPSFFGGEIPIPF